MTLADFLLARVADDEQVARAAADDTPEWEYEEAWGSWRIQSVATDRFGNQRP